MLTSVPTAAPRTRCARRRFAVRDTISQLCVLTAGLQGARDHDDKVDPDWAEDLNARVRALTDEVYAKLNEVCARQRA